MKFSADNGAPPLAQECSACSRAKGLAWEVFNLEQALGFVQEEALVPALALALHHMQSSARCSIAELQEILDQELPEVLNLALDWRMLLPAGSAESNLAWEDLRLDMLSAQKIQIPAVIQLLSTRAARSATWQPELALSGTSEQLGEDRHQLLRLIDYARQYAPGRVLSANQLKACLWEAGLSCNLDALIVEWKAAGVISPRLSSLRSVCAHRSPVYELNPSVFLANYSLLSTDHTQ